MSYVRESTVEKHLVKQMEKHGGRCYKWVSPGNPGVPDRICIFPGGYIVFIETKSPTKGLEKRQEIQFERLKHLGCEAYLVDTKDKVDIFIAGTLRFTQ